MAGILGGILGGLAGLGAGIANANKPNKPSKPGGSANNVVVNDKNQQGIKDQMNANSEKWHTADEAGKKELEEKNKELAGLLGGDVSGSFDAGTGTWGGTAGQTQKPPSYTPSQPNDYSDYLADMYAAQKKQALAALKGAYDKNVNSLDRAQESIAPQYQNARNQAAATNEQQKRAFAEQAAAMGLNSGAQGQAELARSVTLQRNLNDITTSEKNTLADLELQRTQAETDYNAAIAQAEASGDFALAQSLYQEKVRVDEALRSQQLQQYQMELARYEQTYREKQDGISQDKYQNSLDQQNYNNRLEWAQYLAQFGDFSAFDGIATPDQIAAMENQWKLENGTMVPVGQGQRTAPTPKGPDPDSLPPSASIMNKTIGVGGLDRNTISAGKNPGDSQRSYEPSANAEAYAQVRNEAAMVADSMNGTQKVLSVVRRALENGTITQAQAEAILKNYSLM